MFPTLRPKAPKVEASIAEPADPGISDLGKIVGPIRVGKRRGLVKTPSMLRPGVIGQMGPGRG